MPVHPGSTPGVWRRRYARAQRALLPGVDSSALFSACPSANPSTSAVPKPSSERGQLQIRVSNVAAILLLLLLPITFIVALLLPAVHPVKAILSAYCSGK